MILFIELIHLDLFISAYSSDLFAEQHQMIIWAHFVSLFIEWSLTFEYLRLLFDLFDRDSSKKFFD